MPSDLLFGPLLEVKVHYKIEINRLILSQRLKEILKFLSVMDETGKMIGSSCWLVVVGVAIISEKPLSTYYGENFCNITYYLSVYGTVHNFLGGFGIALMRLIFIRFPSKVQLGQMTMTLAICLTTFLLSILVTFYWSTTPRPDQDLTSLCRAESTEFTGAVVVLSKMRQQFTQFLIEQN